MKDKNIKINHSIEDLLFIVAQLRDPKTGCPWDLEQGFETTAQHTIEEAYEVADAIESGSMEELRNELGDLLFQVVFHSQLASEYGGFVFDDVVAVICNKLTNRHQPVSDGERIAKKDLSKQWRASKRKEKDVSSPSILDGVNMHQSATNSAYKMQKKAASVGFDWEAVEPVMEKLEEEIIELKNEIDITNNRQRIEEELGDVLFSCINLARHLDVNPEWSLRKANRRFADRFRFVEREVVASGNTLDECSMNRLDKLWNKAKKKVL